MMTLAAQVVRATALDCASTTNTGQLDYLRFIKDNKEIPNNNLEVMLAATCNIRKIRGREARSNATKTAPMIQTLYMHAQVP